MMKALVLAAALLSLPGTASAESLARRLDAYLDAYSNAGQFSGVVLIAKGDQVVYSRALGFADMRSRRRMQLDTVFPLASLSKAFTGAAIIDLQRRGRVSFSDPLARPSVRMKHRCPAPRVCKVLLATFTAG